MRAGNNAVGCSFGNEANLTVATLVMKLPFMVSEYTYIAMFKRIRHWFSFLNKINSVQSLKHYFS
jgi:hypothetical protein